MLNAQMGYGRSTIPWQMATGHSGACSIENGPDCEMCSG